MEVTLTRPDGEGSAIYRREGGLVRVEGKWAGLGFEQAIDLASEATWAPWCFAADGLHFRHVDLLGTVARLTCLALKPDGDGNPLAAVMARFEASFVAEETVMIGGAVFAAGRFRTVYSEMPAKATDFWIHGDGWPLRMATVREDGSSREIVAARVVLAENAVHRPTSSRPNP